MHKKAKRRASKASLPGIYHDWLCYQLPLPLNDFQRRLRWSKDKIVAISSGERKISKKDLRQLEKAIPGVVPFDQWVRDSR